MVVAAIYDPPERRSTATMQPGAFVKWREATATLDAAARDRLADCARATRAWCSRPATSSCGRTIAAPIRKATSRRRAAATRRASSRRSRSRRSSSSASTSASDPSTTTDMRILIEEWPERSSRRSPLRPPRRSRRATPSRRTCSKRPIPTIIDPSSVQSAAGATAVRNGALSRLRTATADGESTWLFGGLLVDEWAHELDVRPERRDGPAPIQLNNSTVNGELRALYRVRTDGQPGDRAAQQVQADAGVRHRRDVFRARIRRAAAGVGLLQRHSAERRRRATPVTLGKPLPVKDVFAVASRRSTRRWR